MAVVLLLAPAGAVATVIHVFEDPTCAREVPPSPEAENWRTLGSSSVFRAAPASGCFWLAVPMQDHSIVRLASNHPKEVKFFDSQSTSITVSRLTPPNQRAIDDRYFAFETSANQVFIGLESGGVLTVPIQRYTPSSFAQALQREYLVQGLYFGSWLLFIFVAIALLVVQKTTTNAFYLFYSLAFGGLVLLTSGIGFQWIWPGIPAISESIAAAGRPLVVLAAVGFVRNFGQTKNYQPLNDKLILVSATLFAVFSLGGLVPGLETLAGWSIWVVPVMAATLGWVIIGLFRRNPEEGLLVVAGFGLMAAGATVEALANLNVIEFRLAYQHGLQWGGWADLMLLGVVLVRRLYIERSNLIRDVAMANQQLGRRVARGTADLNETVYDQLTHPTELQDIERFVAHDFRNPLAALTAQLEMLEREPADSEKRHDRHQALRRNLKRLDVLMDHWLEELLSSSATYRFQKHAVDLAQMLESIVELFPDTRLDVPPNSRTIQGDERLLRMLFTNLIENGHKHGVSDFGVLVEVTIGAEYMVVEVSDKGVGLTEPEPPVQRGSSAIGLSLCQKIAELHHSELRVRENLPQGAVFSLRFLLD